MRAAMLVQLVLLAAGGVAPRAATAAGEAPVAEPTRAAAAAPLAGCVATPAGDEVWTYECAELQASVLDDARTLEPASYLRGHEVALRAKLPDPVTVVRERAAVAGRDAQVLRARGARGTGAITALVPTDAGTRVVQCDALVAERCDAVVEALAAAPWRSAPAAGAVRGDAPVLRIGDRTPAVPAGCRARPGLSGGQIVCPGGYVAAWAVFPDEASRDRASGQLVASMPVPDGPEAPERDEVPCRIGSEDASCSRLRFPATKGSRKGHYVVMWGAATLGGQPAFAICTGIGAQAVPPPCASVFALR